MALFKRKKTEAPVAPAANAPAKVEKAEKVTARDESGRPARTVSTLALRTILGPLATEKTAHLADRGVYAFRVANDANRVAVKQAVRELYKVTPVKVNIVSVRGTAKRFGRFVGQTGDWKKALVTLPKGSHINVFESV